MNKKIYILILVLFMTFLLTGCYIDKSRYNVEIVEDGYSFVDGYLESHDPSTATNNQSLDEYTIVIRDEDELNAVFNKFGKIDFNDQMIIVYIYTSIYNSKVKITDVDYDNDGELSIEFKHKSRSGRGSATAPKQGVLIIVMDKLYTTDIDVDQE